MNRREFLRLIGLAPMVTAGAVAVQRLTPVAPRVTEIQGKLATLQGPVGQGIQIQPMVAYVGPNDLRSVDRLIATIARTHGWTSPQVQEMQQVVIKTLQ